MPFSPKGRSYNPLRKTSLLGNPDLDCPIVVVCGADGNSGGNLDFKSLVEQSRYCKDGSGMSQLITVPGADKNVLTNVDGLTETIIDVCQGHMTSRMDVKENPEAEADE